MNDCELRDLGVIPYREAWSMQETLLDSLGHERELSLPAHHFLLMCEHPHVFTLGKHGLAANMLADAEAKGAELIRVDRGGDITYHGPGQLVVYPIFRLDVMQTGIKDYIHRLEEAVIRTIAHYGISGCRVDKATGVWLDPQTPRERKICAIGVRCSRSVTMHGLALNVSTDLSYFRYIHPCGFIDKGVTSIEMETGRKVDIHEVKSLMLDHIVEIFKLNINELLI